MTNLLQFFVPTMPAQHPVVVAARDLPVGTQLDVSDLKISMMLGGLTVGLVASIEDVASRTLLVPMSAGSPIFAAAISLGDLAELAPPGMVVVPIRLDAGSTAVLVAGDVVDLVAVTGDGPQLLARSALVLPARAEPPRSSSWGALGNVNPQVAVTLIAVHPGEAPYVASSAHLGQVTAILVPR
jgi:Flp pilus assembly protein CpaB